MSRSVDNGLASVSANTHNSLAETALQFAVIHNAGHRFPLPIFCRRCLTARAVSDLLDAQVGLRKAGLIDAGCDSDSAS